MKTTVEQSKDGCNENDATDTTRVPRSTDSRRFLQRGSSQRVQAQTHRADGCGTAEVERLLEQQVRQERTLLACGPAACDTGRHSGPKENTHSGEFCTPSCSHFHTCSSALSGKLVSIITKKKKKRWAKTGHMKRCYIRLE